MPGTGKTPVQRFRSAVTAPERRVVRADALVWLAENPAESGMSVVTSLPDVSELPALDFAGWRTWFVGAVQAVLRWIPEDGVAMFYQSDVRRGGTWLDKSYLVLRAADELGAPLVFHKIVCRKPPGTPSNGRASYSHLVCFSKRQRAAPQAPSPDVLADAGFMPWSKAMGERACELCCRFLLDETSTSIVVDPFCGQGTVLAVANALGLSALGVDSSARKCRAARRLSARSV